MPARCHFSALRRVLAVAACAGAAAGAAAAPLSFSVSSVAMSLGSGYGGEASEPGGTKLDAWFSNAAFAPQDIVLANVNDSFTFHLGTLTFNESSIGGQETDGLGLGADFSFSGPQGMAGAVAVAGTGVARPGTVRNDDQVDFSVTWAPLTFSFGNGALLGLTLNDLAFDSTASLLQTATITLLRAEGSAGVPVVPEPGGLALVSLGLLLMGGAMRRARRR